MKMHISAIKQIMKSVTKRPISTLGAVYMAEKMEELIRQKTREAEKLP